MPSTYLPFTAADWNQVIFPTNPGLLRRYKSKYTCKTLKYGGISLLVWGAIRADGYRILIQCHLKLGSQEYQKVLRIGLSALYTPQMVFMQDGAPWHRSSSILAYLDNKNVCLFSDWPAQSPDLNIIENLWALLKKNIRKHHPILKDDWYTIPNDYITSLWVFTSRLHEAFRNKGLNTKY